MSRQTSLRKQIGTKKRTRLIIFVGNQLFDQFPFIVSGHICAVSGCNLPYCAGVFFKGDKKREIPRYELLKKHIKMDVFVKCKKGLKANVEKNHQCRHRMQLLVNM